MSVLLDVMQVYVDRCIMAVNVGELTAVQLQAAVDDDTLLLRGPQLGGGLNKQLGPAGVAGASMQKHSGERRAG